MIHFRIPSLGWARWLAVVVVAACTASSSPARPPLPPGPAQVDVAMREYAFDYNKAIPAGRVVFRAHNAGRLQHYLTLVPLPEDMPPINEQLHGTTRRNLDDFAGITTRLPGGRSSFAVDLVAGHRYALLCFIQDPDGVNHAFKGMNSEFRVGASTTGTGKP